MRSFVQARCWAFCGEQACRAKSSCKPCGESYAATFNFAVHFFLNFASFGRTTAMQ